MATSFLRSDSENDCLLEDGRVPPAAVVVRRSRRTKLLVGIAACALAGTAAFATFRSTALPSSPNTMAPGEIISENFWGGSSPTPAKKPAKKPSAGHGGRKKSGVTWTLGKTRESCDVACSNLNKNGVVMECNPASFEDTVNATGVKKIASKAGLGKCKKTVAGTSGGGAPEVYKSMITGTECKYHTRGAMCSALPSNNYQRLCPCSKAITSLQWRLGQKGDSCDQTCMKLSPPGAPAVACDSKALSAKRTESNMKVVMNGVQPAKISCSVKTNASMHGTPQYVPGIMGFGNTCYNSNMTSLCSDVPDRNNQRICPCGPPGSLTPTTGTSQMTGSAGSGVTPARPPTSSSSPSPPSPPSTPTSSSSGKPTWVIHGKDLSCTDVCKAKGATCSNAAFSQVSPAGVWQLSQQLHLPCTGEWTNDGLHGADFQNTPAECMDTVCKSGDSKGLCALPQKGHTPNCQGRPPKGWARMCPCVGGSAR